MAHLFISYDHKDVDFVALLKMEIEQAGFDVWVDADELRAGDDWRQGIDESIRAAFALIVIMTPEAKASEYVTYEWACGWGAGVKVIPIMLRPTALHPRLESLQYLDFTRPDRQPWYRLIERLQEMDKAHNPTAIRLPRNTPIAIQQAVTALDSHNPTQRKAAIQSLVQIDHPQALEALIFASHHITRDVRIEAAFELAAMDNAAAIPGLLEALDDPAQEVRLRAAKFLGRVGDQHTVASLIQAMREDSDRNVRLAAATALGELGYADAIPALGEALASQDSNMRTACADALGRIRHPDAVPYLIKALNNPDGGVNRAVISAMGDIADPRAIPSLAYNLTGQPGDVVLEIIGALGKIGHPDAITPLVDMTYQFDHPKRIAAIEALAHISYDDSVLRVLMRLLDEGDALIRIAAAKAMGEMKNPLAVQKLTGQLKDIHSGVRENACAALEKIGTPEALQAVAAWRQEPGRIGK